MNILKFGGTSVGSAENMRRVAQIVTAQGPCVVVLSAMSGTTDALTEVCRVALQGGDVAPIVERIRTKYTECIESLLADTAGLHELLDKALEHIQNAAVWWREGVSDRSIVAQGELVTSAIFAAYMREQGHKTVLLSAPEIVRKDAEGKAAVKMPTLDKGVYYITQGFICSDAAGNIDNLGRGGSDYSAALIGAALGARQVQIWTDIDGMHNNDPRYVQGTRPIRRMSFDEAAELAYFGAKILHPAAILPCREKGIPVALKNTMDPAAEGTLITAEESGSPASPRAVAAKDGITAIRIDSARMLMAYGFLRRVFEIFERHRTPIDMITTSEVAVSLTIDNDAALDEIVAELRELGAVEVERDNTIVCVVGGALASVRAGVEVMPVKMISYGASRRSVAMLIDTGQKRDFLQYLNDRLFDA